MTYGWKRLNREEKIIIALLNEDMDAASELISKKPEPDYHLLMTIAYQNRVAPLLLSVFLKHFSSRIDKDTIQKFKVCILQQMTMNKMHKKTIIDGARILCQAGFDVTLMKGFSYDPEEKYPRVMGDVDFLIEEKYVLEVIEVLKTSNYHYKGSAILSFNEKQDIQGQLNWNNQYQFDCPDSSDTIEIHTNLFERDRIRRENLTTLLDKPCLFLKKRIWNTDMGCYIPGTEASLMLLCLHCSMKRSLNNNMFILRHITDMDTLFEKGIDEDFFIAICREAQISYHVLFAIRLYCLIREKDKKDLLAKLEMNLTRSEKTLANIHMKCLGNLRDSRKVFRIMYKFTAPFIIGGSKKKRRAWMREYFFPTRVKQESRYIRWGFTRESPWIYLTYFINPFRSIWQLIKRVLKLKGSSWPES